MLEYEVDHRVRLDTRPGNKNLYTWAIQEFDAKGKQLGSDQIPWNWTLRFVAKSLRHTLTTTLKTEDSPQDPKASRLAVSSEELISTVLEPLIEKRTASHYSMFGTTRKISQFDLRINKGPANQADVCRIYGGLQYTSEWDFEQVTQPDYIQIEVVLSPLRFNQIKESISLQADKTFLLYLKNVHGFYSNWSPAIRTETIKILTKPKDHGLEIPADSKITPPTLGEVEEFQLVFINAKSTVAAAKEDEQDIFPQAETQEARIAPASQQQTGFDPAYRKSMLWAVRATAIAAWVLAIVVLLKVKF